MSYKKALLLFTAAFILQFSVINLVSIDGVTPDLLLCLVMIITFLYDDGYRYSVLGIVFALLRDVCVGQYVGVGALGTVVVIGIIIFFEGSINKENFMSTLIVAASGTLIYNLFCWAVLALLGNPTSILYVLMYQPLSVAYNVAVVSLMYKFMIKKAIRHQKDRYYV